MHAAFNMLFFVPIAKIAISQGVENTNNTAQLNTISLHNPPPPNKSHNQTTHQKTPNIYYHVLHNIHHCTHPSHREVYYYVLCSA